MEEGNEGRAAPPDLLGVLAVVALSVVGLVVEHGHRPDVVDQLRVTQHEDVRATVVSSVTIAVI